MKEWKKGMCMERKTAKGKVAQSRNFLKMVVLILLLVIIKGQSTIYAETLKERTQKEVSDMYFQLYNLNKPTYASTPNVNLPYSEGSLTSTTLKDGLNMVNLMRYIAGYEPDIVLDSTYCKQAQAAALVQAVNGGLSHYPAKPLGMSDELYNLAATASSHSNLAAGYTGISSSIYAYMDDTDNYNIDKLGHRRWILSPWMGKIGFGFVNNYSATYVFDASRTKEVTYDGIMWPAKQMPIELFRNQTAWSVNLGEDFGMPDYNKVTVTLTRASDGRTWTMNAGDTDKNGEYFNVENQYYGPSKCIIFRPENITIAAGDVYKVTISGLTDNNNNAKNYSYTVCFFSVKNPKIETTSISKATVSSIADKVYTGKSIKPAITLKYNGNVLKQGTDYTVSYTNCVYVGKGKITIKGIGKYSGTKTATFKIIPSKVSGLKQSEAYTASLKLKWTKKTSAAGYEIYRYNSASNSYKKIKTIATNTNSYKDTNLTAGKIYKYKVRCYNIVDGVKYYSYCCDTIQAATIPSKVVWKNITSGTKKAVLSWSKVSGATGYEIYYSTSYNGTYKKIYTTVSGNTVSKTISSLTSGKKYCFKIRAFKVVDGKKYYGYYSMIKSVQIK